MFKIEIELDSKYNIYIDKNINITRQIKEVFNNKNIFIITDEVVASIHLENLLNQLIDFNVKVITIKSGEQNKNLQTYAYITTLLTSYNITRDSLIIGFGGGVVGDISSFVASTILRGIQYVCIPTTLLSQVDSSIGGKTGLNLNNKKNIIGTFHQPSLVLIDTCYLESLSKEEFDNGLCEVIKCSFIKNKVIMSLLSENFDIKEIIYKCLLVKKYYVELDPFDKNERMILNFGHTFGHVIELEKNIKHGFAVAQGMIMAIEYGIDLEITNKECLSELKALLSKLEIPFEDINYIDYLSKLNGDKKNMEGELNFILIENIGTPLIKKIKRK